MTARENNQRFLRRFKTFVIILCASMFQLTLLCDEARHTEIFPNGEWVAGGADGKVNFHGFDPDAWIVGAPDG